MMALSKKIHTTKRLFWGMIWCMTLILVAFLLFLSFLQKVEITRVNLNSEVSFTPEELKKQIGVNLPELYLNVDTNKIKQKLELHPLVYSAKVRKNLKGQLFIDIIRSSPLIAILAKKGDAFVPAYFDVHGKCVQVGASGGLVDTPIVSGISIVDPTIGVFLPAWVTPILEDLKKIKVENSALFNQLSEIKITAHKDNYKTLEIWFVNYPQKYIVNIDINTQTLERLWFFADRINREHFVHDFTSFDLRQGVIIGKRKEKNDKKI